MIYPSINKQSIEKNTVNNIVKKQFKDRTILKIKVFIDIKNISLINSSILIHFSTNLVIIITTSSHILLVLILQYIIYPSKNKKDVSCT